MKNASSGVTQRAWGPARQTIRAVQIPLWSWKHCKGSFISPSLVFGDSGWVFFENGTKLSALPFGSTCMSVPAVQTGSPSPLPACSRPQDKQGLGLERLFCPPSPSAWLVHGQVCPTAGQMTLFAGNSPLVWRKGRSSGCPVDLLRWFRF